MPKLQWALVCRRVITDTETNAVSYIDAAEGFNAKSFPCPLPILFVCSLWRRENKGDVLDMRIRLFDKDNSILKEFKPEKPFEMPRKRHRVNIGLSGISLVKPGYLNIVIEQRIEKEWVIVSSIPVDVELNQA